MNQSDFKKIQNKLLPLITSGNKLIKSKISNGKNNNLWLIQESDVSEHIKKKFIVKFFFDDSDRYEHEIYFFNYLKRIDLPIPKIIDNEEKKFIIFSYIESQSITSNFEKEFVIQSAEFFYKINNYFKEKGNYKFTAKEAFFDFNSQLNFIEKRLLALIDFTCEFKDAKNLLINVKDRWITIKNQIIEMINDEFSYLNNKISSDEICLSPSDFGRHNCILNNNHFYFIDFEYAGLDDPAKMICDFFLQPQFEINISNYDIFVNKCLRDFDKDEISKIKQRSKLFFYAFRVKWILIILNIFLKKNYEKILYNNKHSKFDNIYNERLNLAKIYLDKIPLNGLKNETFRSWLRGNTVKSI